MISHLHINIPSTVVNYSPMTETYSCPPSLTARPGYLAAGEARESVAREARKSVFAKES
jgi:hypothetical protein